MSTNKRWRNARKGRWLKFPALRRQPPKRAERVLDRRATRQHEPRARA